MWRFVYVALLGAILASAIATQADHSVGTMSPEAEQTKTFAKAGLRGVWKLTEAAVRRPGGDWVRTTPGSSLYIFTEKHYSYTFATGNGPRRLFAGDPNSPTDAEKVGAYDSFVAAAGTYVLSGSTLTLTATLHKNPNEMTGEPLTYAIELDADTLRMTIVNPPFAPGRERRVVLTRVE
jgi:hypothetical protein